MATSSSTVDGHPTGHEPPELEVRDLAVTYGGVRALEGVDLRVSRGEVVAILGSNGAGKTTLVRSLTGILSYYGARITHGQIYIRGSETSRATPASVVRSGVSQVMEGRRVFSELTVTENLRAGGHTCRARQDLHGRLDEVMGRFPQLARRKDVHAGYLSGGEQQMLAIGRALMQAPQVLLLDEPSLGLAPVIVSQIRDLILELKSSGTTVLLIEQNVAMALEVADRAYVLRQGRVARSGPADEMLSLDAIREVYLGTREETS